MILGVKKLLTNWHIAICQFVSSFSHKSRNSLNSAISSLKILGRLNYAPNVLAFDITRFFVSLYENRYSRVCLDITLLGEVSSCMTMIQRALIKKVKKVESDVSELNRLESELKEEVSSSLNQCLEIDSFDAVVYDRVTHIQCIVDKVREYTESRKFFSMKLAVEDAISEIKVFHKEFSLPVPDEIFPVLSSGINTHLTSLRAMRDAVCEVIQIRSFPDSEANLDVFKTWANSLESFSEEFEDNQEFFPSEIFASLEVLATEIVLKCRVKQPQASTSEKEVYRRRIRYAAGFLLNVIEASQEEADEEDLEVISSLSQMSALTLHEMLPGEEGENWHNHDQEES